MTRDQSIAVAAFSLIFFRISYNNFNQIGARSFLSGAPLRSKIPNANSDEVGHLFKAEAGHRSDLKPAGCSDAMSATFANALWVLG